MMRRLAFSALLASLVSGCVSVQPPVWSAPAAEADLNYQQVYEDWTHKKVHYDQLNAQTTAEATYLSPRFIAALVEHQGESEGLPEDKVKALRAARVSQANREAKFLVAIATQEMRWDDLDQPESTMRIVLREGAREIEPLSLVKLSRRETTVQRLYYPHIGPLSNAYWVTFPAPVDPKHVVLRIAGPPGYVDLTWKSR